MKAYIFGPITLNGEDYVSVYKYLTTVCKSFFDEIVCTYPDFWDSKETPRKFYDRTYTIITKCDWFIAEVSSASMGVGMELQMGVEKKIPLIALCKKGMKLSQMVLGLPNLKEVIYYENLDDAGAQLIKALKFCSI